MAYLIFSTLKGRELSRQELCRSSIVIGRSPECHFCVHDILLSRRHCRIEAEGLAWVIVDLASKNGTYLDNQEIGRHELRDGQTVRIGKTAVTYCAGQIQAAQRGGEAYGRPNKSRPRPADPWAAMHDTMSGFDYLKSVTERKTRRIGGPSRFAGKMPPTVDVSHLPTPQPSPLDPQAYRSDDIYSLLTELASSSWDSIYMNASRPMPTCKPIALNSRSPRRRPSSPVDLSLQAEVVRQAPNAQNRAKGPSRWAGAIHGVARGLAAVGQSVLVMGIMHLLVR